MSFLSPFSKIGLIPLHHLGYCWFSFPLIFHVKREAESKPAPLEIWILFLVLFRSHLYT